jgi:hypothetical protein
MPSLIRNLANPFMFGTPRVIEEDKTKAVKQEWEGVKAGNRE